MTRATRSLECQEEDCPVRGNALASGDDAFDRKVENKIIAQLNLGNQWAWCCVKVTVKFGQLEGNAYLGCCSYKSEKEFRQEGGYYIGMVDEALDELTEQVWLLLTSFVS